MKRLIWLAVLWVLATSAQAAPRPASDEAARHIRQVLAEGGQQAYLDAVPGIVERGLAQRGREGAVQDAGREEQVRQLLTRHYDRARLTERVVAQLATGYDANRYAFVQRIFATEAVKTTQRLRRQANTAEAFPEIQKLADRQRRDKEPIPPLIVTLDGVTGDSEYSAGVQALAVLAILNAVNPPGTPAQQDQLLRQLYAQYAEPSRQTVQLTLQYALWGVVPAAQLQQVIDLYSQEPVRWYLTTVLDAITEVMLQANQEVAAALRPKKKAPAKSGPRLRDF